MFSHVLTKLRQPVIVVGTPGKLMDHAMEGFVCFRSSVRAPSSKARSP